MQHEATLRVNLRQRRAHVQTHREQQHLVRELIHVWEQVLEVIQERQRLVQLEVHREVVTARLEFRQTQGLQDLQQRQNLVREVAQKQQHLEVLLQRKEVLQRREVDVTKIFIWLVS